MQSDKLLKILFVISIIFLILLTNLKLVSLNFDLYKKEFQKLNVYEKIPDADKHALNIINYHKNKENLSNFFNEKEKLHLKDVKDLITLGNILFYLSLILTLGILIYLIYKKYYLLILNSLIISSLITSLLIILIFVSNFSNLFTNFHLLIFNNDLWIFNVQDNLVNLFPERFFYNILIIILRNTFIISLVLLTLSLILKSNKKLLNNNSI